MIRIHYALWIHNFYTVLDLATHKSQPKTSTRERRVLKPNRKLNIVGHQGMIIQGFQQSNLKDDYCLKQLIVLHCI